MKKFSEVDCSMQPQFKFKFRCEFRFRCKLKFTPRLLINTYLDKYMKTSLAKARIDSRVIWLNMMPKTMVNVHSNVNCGIGDSDSDW